MIPDEKTKAKRPAGPDLLEAQPVPQRDDVQLPSLPSGPSLGTMQGELGPAMSGKGGKVLGGKFRILRELGSGGAGAVYEVLHEVTHHKRALKLMKLQDNDENVERIFREASAAGRIGNPHIIETLDAGRFDTGEIYVLMELVQGDTLFRYIEKHRSLTLHGVIELICQACDGLHAAHEAGIIHRDVKPANMMVTLRDGKPFVKILDFGISKFDTRKTDVTELTQDGTLLGTPSYMAPEQLKGADIDLRVDIFALGVTLYSVCAGKRPFQGRTFAEIALAVMQDDHLRLWDICPHLPPAFTAIVERAMATSREDRFETAAEFADALRGELESAFSSVRKPLSMPPPPISSPLSPILGLGATPASPDYPPISGLPMSNDLSQDAPSAQAQVVEVVHVEMPSEPRRFRLGPQVAGIVLVASVLASIVAIGISRTKSAASDGPPVVPPTHEEVVGTPQVQREGRTSLPPASPVNGAPQLAGDTKPAVTAPPVPPKIPNVAAPNTVGTAPSTKPTTPRTAPTINRYNPYN